jgi:uncharacterized protein (TIGR02996 family)
MDTPQDLLEAICMAPDDDSLRGRFAKMIEPSDPPYAELIRLQLARARHEHGAGTMRSRAEGREAALLAAHGARWSRYMASFLVPLRELDGDLGCTFERGFIAHARVAIENVVGMGARLFMFAPIQHLDVTPGDGDPRRVFDAPGLERLHSISLRGLALGNAGAQALAECAALSQTTWMDLSLNELELGGVLALASSAMMQNKVHVEFAPNPCDPVEQPYFDSGILVDVSARFPPEKVEELVGHAVPWLHYTWGSGPKPDRFHTRYVVR